MAIRTIEQARRALRHAGEDSFVTQNLEEIASLKELAEKFRNMRDDVYKYHVGESYNHFSEWVHHVFEDAKLARDIADAAREKAAKIIEDRIEWLEEKAKD